MTLFKIPDSEYRFCLILWKYEPIGTGELVKVCARELGWKRSTTYTVIKRLSDRQIIRQERGQIRALISKEQAQREEMNRFFQDKFEGSLPDFVAAFTHERLFSAKDIEDMQKIIEDFRQGE